MNLRQEIKSMTEKQIEEQKRKTEIALARIEKMDAEALGISEIVKTVSKGVVWLFAILFLCIMTCNMNNKVNDTIGHLKNHDLKIAEAAVRAAEAELKIPKYRFTIDSLRSVIDSLTNPPQPKE